MAFTTNATSPFTDTPKTPAYGYLALLFIPVLTILGNILVILAVLGDKQLKKSVTNRYIAALAFSDFLVGVIPMPLAVYVKVNGEEWNLGVGLCKFYVACDVTSSTASILHLVVISADRYLAISWPAEYQRYAKNAKITFAIVLVWLISITLSIPVVMGKSILDTTSCWLDNPEYMIYSSLLSFYIPAGVLTLVYVKIFRKIRVRQGIHSMLRAGAGSCGAEVTPFHLPFVVVQEVSFDDHPSSTDKRPSDVQSPSFSTQPANNSISTTHPKQDAIQDGLQCGNDDGHGRTEKKTKSVSKSNTFPSTFGEDETETILCLRECREGRRRKNGPQRGFLRTRFQWASNRSRTEDPDEFDADRTRRYGSKRRKKCEKQQADKSRLLSRTSSEKGDYKDSAVQTRPRRFSLWYHHSCQHVGDLMGNGDCFVLGDDDDDELANHNGGLSYNTFDSSLLSLKGRHKTKHRHRSRRASSSFEQFVRAGSPIGASAAASPAGVDRAGSSIRLDRVHDDDEDEVCETAGCYSLPGSMSKTKGGFYLKKLANRVTTALHRITETQAVTKEKKATKLVALILGVFVISWLPFFTFNTVRGICLSAVNAASSCDWWSSRVFFFTSWLGYANSSFNPIIYALVNQRFRATYKRLLGWPGGRRT